MTDQQRETAVALGRATLDQEIAFFSQVIDVGGAAGELGLVKLMDDFDGATPDAIRAMSDATLEILSRVGVC